MSRIAMDIAGTNLPGTRHDGTSRPEDLRGGPLRFEARPRHDATTVSDRFAPMVDAKAIALPGDVVERFSAAKAVSGIVVVVSASVLAHGAVVLNHFLVAFALLGIAAAAIIQVKERRYATKRLVRALTNQGLSEQEAKRRAREELHRWLD